jgi:hypothetical protein
MHDARLKPPRDEMRKNLKILILDACARAVEAVVK